MHMHMHVCMRLAHGGLVAIVHSTHIDLQCMCAHTQHYICVYMPRLAGSFVAHVVVGPGLCGRDAFALLRVALRQVSR